MTMQVLKHGLLLLGPSGIVGSGVNIALANGYTFVAWGLKGLFAVVVLAAIHYIDKSSPK